MTLRDPIAEMRKEVRKLLLDDGVPEDQIADDAQIRDEVRWRPHVWDASRGRGWYCATEDADSESWLARIQRAQALMPELKIGVCATASVVSTVIDELDALESAVIVLSEDSESANIGSGQLSATLCDFIYEQRIALEAHLARSVLERNYNRALNAQSSTEKGVRLETVVAVALSQVTGYHVSHKGISNRSQQMDVVLVNRNASGALAGGAIVLAEAKNWKDPVTPTEYYGIVRKVEGRNGRCKLGVLITTGRFTSGVEDQAKVDSAKDVMILRLDGESFPGLWRSVKGIAATFEDRMIECMIGG